MDAAVMRTWEDQLLDKGCRAAGATARIPEGEAEILLAVAAQQMGEGLRVHRVGESCCVVHWLASKLRMWAMYAFAVRPVLAHAWNGRLQYSQSSVLGLPFCAASKGLSWTPP